MDNCSRYESVEKLITFTLTLQIQLIPLMFFLNCSKYIFLCFHITQNNLFFSIKNNIPLFLFSIETRELETVSLVGMNASEEL